MYKKVFILVSLILVTVFSFSVCFANDATNMLENAGNNVKNAVGDVQNATEDAARNISGATKDATENVAQKANNVGNEFIDGDNGDEYTTTRVAADTTNNNTFMGMDANTWTWLIVGVAAIAIIALIWYYTMQLRSSDNHRD